MVKGYPEGKMSKHIVQLEPGDTLECKGPIPKLPYKANMKKNLGMVRPFPCAGASPPKATGYYTLLFLLSRMGCPALLQVFLLCPEPLFSSRAGCSMCVLRLEGLLGALGSMKVGIAVCR